MVMSLTSRIRTSFRTYSGISTSRNSSYGRASHRQPSWDGVQLVCGDNSSLEKKVQTMRAGWASDPAHPNGHIYAKMALNLIETVAGATAPQTVAAGGRKRSWSSSNRDDQGPDYSSRYPTKRQESQWQ
jgi:hypothetical protein